MKDTAKMNIIHLTQYYPPEPGAVQVRAQAIASSLVQFGHHVTVLTEMPNHPVGVIYPDYKGKLFSKEVLDDVEVLRVWVKTTPKKNFYTRIAFYLSYMLNAGLRGIFLRRKYDFVFANSPPLFVGVAGLFLSFVHRIPFVFEVQDLWPESAVDMGELRNQRFIRWATWLEEKCYQYAERIVVVSDGIYNRLVERGIDPQKIRMVENGSNTRLFKPQPEQGARLRAHWGLDEKFIVFYGGIIGLAQGLETIVETAQRLVTEPDIHFVMVGEGPRRAALEAMLADLNLPNFTFLPGQTLEAMPAHLNAADVALAPLRDLPVFEGVRPTKIFDAWACERPVIVSARGEPCRIVQEAEGGLCTAPECPDEIANAILALRDQPELRLKLGLNGKKFVDSQYSLQAMAAKLELVLRDLL